MVTAKRETGGDCEVCKAILGKVVAELKESDFKDYTKIAEKLREICGGTRDTKDNKFCFYIGALPESATSIINEVTNSIVRQKLNYR